MSFRSEGHPRLMRAGQGAPGVHKPRSRTRRGFALESTLLLMMVCSVVVLGGLAAVATMTKTAAADYRSSRATYAAEGAADDVMSQLDADMADGSITADDLSKLQTPQITGFRITQSTQTSGTPSLHNISSGTYAGLDSMTTPLDITVSARDSSGNKAGAVISVNAEAIPIFQFGAFFQNDIEIEPSSNAT